MRARDDRPREPDLPIVRMVRWVARIAGTAVVLMVTLFMIGEGAPNPLKLRGIEIATSAAFFAMVAGLLIAWWREGLGGFLTVGGFVAFWVLNIAVTGGLRLPGAFPIFPFVGFLHLFCWRQSIRARDLDRL